MSRIWSALCGLASDADLSEGWEVAAPTIREAMSYIEALEAENARLRTHLHQAATTFEENDLPKTAAAFRRAALKD